MTEATPYDDDRALYTREALARLVLSDHATDMADSAAGLVGTRNDAGAGLGGRSSQALQLIEMAERTLSSAVVYERERGATWAQIANYLGISPSEAEGRYTPAIQRWNEAFEEPYKLDETRRKRVPQLPTAAYDPHYACKQLDQWARLHLVGIDDRQAVSASLIKSDPPPA
ncbi:hypothetical protein ACLQ18_44165 [Streptomyces sp. DT193]|uniref:hypothetical protein n=1 Tax=Streptomyces sp. DT193 TaxID=3393418 RepID=UPI003CF05492